jgi:hypothetical protein
MRDGSKVLDAATLARLRTETRSESGSVKRGHGGGSETSSRKSRKKNERHTVPPVPPVPAASTSQLPVTTSASVDDMLAKTSETTEKEKDQPEVKTACSKSKTVYSQVRNSDEDGPGGRRGSDVYAGIASDDSATGATKTISSSRIQAISHSVTASDDHTTSHSETGIAPTESFSLDEDVSDRLAESISPFQGVPFPSEKHNFLDTRHGQATRARISSTETAITAVSSESYSRQSFESGGSVSGTSSQTRFDPTPPSKLLEVQKDGFELTFESDVPLTVQAVPAQHNLEDKEDSHIGYADSSESYASSQSSSAGFESDNDFEANSSPLDERSFRLIAMRDMPLDRKKQIFGCIAPNDLVRAMFLADQFLNPEYLEATHRRDL